MSPERFVDAVVAARRHIEEFPGSGQPAGGSARRILLATFPYQLVYRIEGDEIRIFAVAHLKRRPGYWKKRRPP